ncbi:MAG: VOC family protein [Solirubrobacterales bacterium]
MITSGDSNPVVHLELHTRDLSRACDFYESLLGWRRDPVDSGDSCTYLGLELGGTLGGGVVECGTTRALWLPYVEVNEIHPATERARRLGAAVLLEPREGPAGWRSVISEPTGAQIALWQPKPGRP